MATEADLILLLAKNFQREILKIMREKYNALFTMKEIEEHWLKSVKQGKAMIKTTGRGRNLRRKDTQDKL